MANSLFVAFFKKTQFTVADHCLSDLFFVKRCGKANSKKEFLKSLTIL